MKFIVSFQNTDGVQYVGYHGRLGSSEYSRKDARRMSFTVANRVARKLGKLHREDLDNGYYRIRVRAA